MTLPEGVQSAMAAWMLAPLACRQLQETPPPRVSSHALLALRDVLDHSGLLHWASPATSGAAPPQGACDAAARSPRPQASGDAALGPSHGLAATPRATTSAVPRPHGPAAHGAGARRTAQGAPPCVSSCVLHLCTGLRPSLSARQAPSQAVTTRRVTGATLPEQTGPAPWAWDRS